MIEDVDMAKKDKSEKEKELEQKLIDLRDTAALRLKDKPNLFVLVNCNTIQLLLMYLWLF